MTNTAETEYAEQRLSTRAASVALAVTKRVAELSDRTSPLDWPEAMLVTDNELVRIVSEEVAEVTAPLLAENARLKEALKEAQDMIDNRVPMNLKSIALGQRIAQMLAGSGDPQ